MVIHQPLSMGTTDINPYHSALISVYSLTFCGLGACLLIFTYHCPPLWGERTTLVLQDHKKPIAGGDAAVIEMNTVLLGQL